MLKTIVKTVKNTTTKNGENSKGIYKAKNLQNKISSCINKSVPHGSRASDVNSPVDVNSPLFGFCQFYSTNMENICHNIMLHIHRKNTYLLPYKIS